MSPVVDATSDSSDDRAEGIETAVEAVRAGQVVVIPTDTVYGIGCDAFAPESVTAVLDAKGRGRDMPPPVLVPDTRTLDGLARQVPAWARDLVERFWPGPLTLVLLAQPSLHWDLGETAGTVALRMPDDEVALEILREVGPMAVTSANRTGEPAATTVVEAATQLGPAVEVYVDAGPRTETEPSTILDCTGEAPVVLREGAVPLDALREALGEVPLRLPGEEADPPSPEDDGGDHGEDPARSDRPVYVDEDPEVAAAEAARLHAPRHGAGEHDEQDQHDDWQDRSLDRPAPTDTEDTPR